MENQQPLSPQNQPPVATAQSQPQYVPAPAFMPVQGGADPYGNKSSNKKFIVVIVILIVALVVGAVAGVAFFFAKGKNKNIDLNSSIQAGVPSPTPVSSGTNPLASHAKNREAFIQSCSKSAANSSLTADQIVTYCGCAEQKLFDKYSSKLYSQEFGDQIVKDGIPQADKDLVATCLN